MILSRRVSLGGAHLDQIDDSIVIKAVDVSVPHEDSGTVDKMGSWGQRQTNQHWQSLDVTVSYAIDIPKTEMTRRREVFDLVNTWAQPRKWLRTNQMDGRRLYVDKVVYPSAGDARDWLTEYTLTFRAFSVPFWQDENPVEIRKNKISSGNVQIQVGGTAPGVLDLSFENVSGAQNTNVKFTVNGAVLDLHGVNLTASETLNLTHTSDGYLRIRAGSRNVYSLLRGADDAYVEPGTTVTVAVTATRAGNLIVKNTARWL